MNRLAPATAAERQGFREAVLIVGLTALLFGFVEAIGWLTTTETTEIASSGAPGSAPSPAPPSISLEVRAVLEVPTPTPTDTPRPTTVATRTSVPEWCDPGLTKPGQLCRKPQPIPLPPTPYPQCAEARVQPNDWCVFGSPEVT
jgi:hypothetical protein